MRFESLELFDVRIDAIDEETAVEHVIENLDAGRGGWVVTPNVDQLRILNSRPDLRKLFSTADLSVADGMPLVWASRIRGEPLPQRVAGSHLIWSLAAAAAKSGNSIFLLGGDVRDVAVKAADNLKAKNPTLGIAGFYSPPHGFEHDANEMALIHGAIDRAKPDIVFCGLGFPKQELLIEDLRKKFPRVWFVASGASISMAAGERPPAPDWMQENGIEWVHRLRQEPRRLFHRYVIGDMPFALRLLGSSALHRIQRSGSAQTTGNDEGVVVLAWTKISARQEDLAHLLSGQVEIVYPERASQNSVVRYMLSAMQTIRFLRRGSYDVLIVTAPPVEAALVCAVFRRRTKPFLLDSHPGAFGLSGDAHSGRLQAVHRWLWRQAASVLVTTPELAKLVDDGGGLGLVFHEPPARWQEAEPELALPRAPAPEEPKRVCVPFIFTRDEPVEVLLSAARQLPDVEFRVTGNPDRLPQETIVPPNVTLVGFLDSKRFLKELAESDVVLVLSTEPQSVMRTAYEAIRLGRPLIVSKTEATLMYFPFAAHTENSGSAVSKAISTLLGEGADSIVRRTQEAREASQRVTDRQVAELRERIASVST